MSLSEDPEIQDEELQFWSSFFEKIRPITDNISKISESIQTSPIGGFLDTAGQLLNDISDAAHIVAQRTAELTYSAILRSQRTSSSLWFLRLH